MQPDELWRADCNLGSSILDLSNMDPHLILVIFLPPLLFESAFGAADAGIELLRAAAAALVQTSRTHLSACGFD